MGEQAPSGTMPVAATVPTPTISIIAPMEIARALRQDRRLAHEGRGGGPIMAMSEHRRETAIASRVVCLVVHQRDADLIQRC